MPSTDLSNQHSPKLPSADDHPESQHYFSSIKEIPGWIDLSNKSSFMQPIHVQVSASSPISKTKLKTKMKEPISTFYLSLHQTILLILGARKVLPYSPSSSHV